MMKKAACAALAALFLLLAACSQQPAAPPETISNDAVPAASIEPQSTLTTDENLLRMRELLLDEENHYRISLLGGPDTLEDGTSIVVDQALLQLVADALTTTEPAKAGGWVDYQPEQAQTEINIQSSNAAYGDGPYYFGIGTHGGGTALLLQIGQDGPDYVTASYLYNSDTIYNTILEEVLKRQAADTVQLSGDYRTFELDADVAQESLLQLGDTLVALAIDHADSVTDASPKAYHLYYMDAASLEITHHTRFEAEGQYVTLEPCAYQDYDFRILRNDGTYTYHNSKNPDDTLERALPDDLAALIEAGLAAQISPVRLSYIADDQNGVYAATDGKVLLIHAGGHTTRLENSEIPTEAIEGYDPATATIEYFTLRLMNGGQTLVCGLEMPGGILGQGQNAGAGFLVYDVPSGEKHWVYDVYNWGYGPYPVLASADGKRLMGLRQPGDVEPVFQLDVTTLEISQMQGLPPLPENNGWDGSAIRLGTRDFETYVVNTSKALSDGREETTVTLRRDGSEQAVTTAVGPQLAFGSGAITEDYLIFRVREQNRTYFAAFQMPA